MKPQCPFFRKPCLEEGCTAYQKTENIAYGAFEAIDPNIIVETYRDPNTGLQKAVIINPFCKALNVYLPREINSNQK